MFFFLLRYNNHVMVIINVVFRDGIGWGGGGISSLILILTF